MSKLVFSVLLVVLSVIAAGVDAECTMVGEELNDCELDFEGNFSNNFKKFYHKVILQRPGQSALKMLKTKKAAWRVS